MDMHTILLVVVLVVLRTPIIKLVTDIVDITVTLVHKAVDVVVGLVKKVLDTVTSLIK